MTFIFHFCFLLEVEDTPRGRDFPPGLRLECVSSGCGRVPGVGVSSGTCALCGGVSSLWGHVSGALMSLVWVCPQCGGVSSGTCAVGRVHACSRWTHSVKQQMLNPEIYALFYVHSEN